MKPPLNIIINQLTVTAHCGKDRVRVRGDVSGYRHAAVETTGIDVLDAIIGSFGAVDRVHEKLDFTVQLDIQSYPTKARAAMAAIGLGLIRRYGAFEWNDAFAVVVAILDEHDKPVTDGPYSTTASVQPEQSEDTY